MKVRSIADREVEIAPEIVERFRAQLRGPLLKSGDPGYEDSRTVWNGMIQKQPALVARCLGVADVQASVRFAREQGVRLAIKGGGHNIAGLGTCDGGLLLDLGLMRGTWVDPGARIARAQGGCLLGDVDRETQVHGLAATLGFVSNTGIAGLTLGGGFGYLTRRNGWTSDTVAEMEVVTAAGRVVRASTKENADLFWGLCGGGGNFGVVTRFDFELTPVGPEIMGGGIAWPAEHAREVLEMLREIAAEAPPELSIATAIRRAPPAPWLDKEIHGKLIILLVVCDSGAGAKGERFISRIKSYPNPVGDILMKRPYVTQQSLLDATQPKGRRYYWKSEYLPGLDPGALDKAIVHAKEIASPHSAVIFFPIGDAVGRQANDYSAVGNRDARWVLNITAAWDPADEDATHIEWARATWRDMRSFSTGGSYINFQTEDEGGDRVQTAYGPNLKRLVEVKRRWDPDNFFQVNKNIAP